MLIATGQGLHLITQNTPNGQKVQIMLEELKDIYGTQWTKTMMYVRDGNTLHRNQSLMRPKVIS